jgi:undecaprenyl diphosphate synthase
MNILKSKINPEPVEGQKSIVIPKHIAIIMDGNRRWAKERGLPVIAGHKKVAEDMLEPLVEHAYNIGVKYLTFWAFSTENWKRNPVEVSGIMSIFRKSLEVFGQRMHKKGIRIRMIGNLNRFSSDIKKSVTDLIELTKNNKRITVIFALDYGGRDEIVRAMNKAESLSAQAGRQLTAESFNEYLDTAGIPDPELIVRTGGEQRLSGFLLWQSEYSELYFPAWYMPEFTPKKLDEVIEEYNSRQRRFGV